MDSTNRSHCVLNRERNGLSLLPFFLFAPSSSDLMCGRNFSRSLDRSRICLSTWLIRPDKPEASFLITQTPNDITSRHAKGRRVTRCQKTSRLDKHQKAYMRACNVQCTVLIMLKCWLAHQAMRVNLLYGGCANTISVMKIASNWLEGTPR